MSITTFSQIIPKTNSLIINGAVGFCVHVLAISPPHMYDRLPHRRAEVAGKGKSRQYPVRRGWIDHWSFPTCPHGAAVLTPVQPLPELQHRACRNQYPHQTIPHCFCDYDDHPRWLSMNQVMVLGSRVLLSAPKNFLFFERSVNR